MHEFDANIAWFGPVGSGKTETHGHQKQQIKNLPHTITDLFARQNIPKRTSASQILSMEKAGLAIPSTLNDVPPRRAAANFFRLAVWPVPFNRLVDLQ
jgi:hypothetical protein